MDRGPELDAPPPATQVCGFKDGKVTLPAECHTWEKAAHLAESFDMVRQRWLQFQTGELMEKSPAARGWAPDGIRNVVLPNQRYTC